MAEIKALDQAGIDFLTQEEGIRLSPYQDVKGIWTTGIGMTYYPHSGKRVTKDDPPLTKEQAIQMFRSILIPYETAVWSTTRDDISQNQFSALTSIAYNIGISAFKNSTLLKRVNANPQDKKIADAFLLWKKPAVLIGRRKREISLYFS